MALLFRFWLSFGILLTFIQSQYSHCSFTQANNLLRIKLKIKIKQFLEVSFNFFLVYLEKKAYLCKSNICTLYYDSTRDTEYQTTL